MIACMAPALDPITLEGHHVTLQPLTLAHVDALCRVGLDPDLWTWTNDAIESPEKMRAYVETALAEQAAGKSLPFATVERATGTVVGSTRYGNIALADRKVEIGWTWIGRAWHRTAVNTEAKLLMLRHAFDTLGCIRVELKTDRLNSRSRNAIARLGAVEEGTLRQHMITASGRIRDTVYYSVLDREWPEVKARLEAFLRKD